MSSNESRAVATGSEDKHISVASMSAAISSMSTGVLNVAQPPRVSRSVAQVT